ncbi:MAG: thioredoxin [Calditrichaeota bacterium]|nr:MAG: thioredoxin [Calditrichota bacterium]MBL1206261.1 thioredoxin [Calditrichota bacterium]NOG46087.1 thioredoxin family protein [Calditrichota bacterium]
MFKNISENILNKKTVLVYIWTESCSKCRKMTPIVEAVVKENKTVVNFFKLKVECNIEVLRTYKVTQVPTTLIFQHGILVERRGGLRSKEVLLKKIQMYKSLSVDEAKNHELHGMKVSKLSRNQYFSTWM